MDMNTIVQYFGFIVFIPLFLITVTSLMFVVCIKTWRWIFNYFKRG